MSANVVEREQIEAIRAGTPDEELERDLLELTPARLRAKYKGEANSHRNTKARCKKNGDYFAPEWNDFRSFLRDMGRRPFPDASLDRIDTASRRYGPGLCRWADKRTQTENRPQTNWVEWRGQTITLADFARQIGRPYQTVYSAWSRGQTLDEVAGNAGPRRVFEKTAWRHPDPNVEPAVAQAFDHWRKKLNREHRRDFGHIDVYYQLYLVNLWQRLLHFADADVEFDPGDPSPRAAEWRLYQALPSRMTYTLECIAERNPHLAARLDPRRGPGPGGWKAIAELLRKAIEPEVR
jgi:hypothetical protein